MKKRAAACFFCMLLISMGFTAQTNTNSVNVQFIRSIPLGVGVWDSVTLDFLNKALGPNDIIAYRPQNEGLMSAPTTARKMLVFGDQDYGQAATLIQDAKTMGAALIGFNLEGQLTREELLEKAREVGKLVKEADLRYMFGPKVADLEKYFPALSRIANILLFQSQNFQTQPNYKQTLGMAIARIKKMNPNVRVWVQVSVNPPGNRTLTVEQVLKNIAAVADMADGIFLFYNPTRWDVAKDVIIKLRSGQ